MAPVPSVAPRHAHTKYGPIPDTVWRYESTRVVTASDLRICLRFVRNAEARRSPTQNMGEAGYRRTAALPLDGTVRIIQA